MASSSSFHPAHVTKAPQRPPKASIGVEGYNEKGWRGNWDMSEHPAASHLPLDTPLKEYKSIKTGKTHERFPRNVGEYFTLSEQILDELAEHFSQKVRNEWTLLYPVKTTPLFGQASNHEMKLYLFGKFIGLGPPLNEEPNNPPQPPHRLSISAEGRSDVYNPSLDPAPKKKRSLWNWLCGGGGHQEG